MITKRLIHSPNELGEWNLITKMCRYRSRKFFFCGSKIKIRSILYRVKLSFYMIYTLRTKMAFSQFVFSWCCASPPRPKTPNIPRLISLAIVRPICLVTLLFMMVSRVPLSADDLDLPTFIFHIATKLKKYLIIIW